MGFFVTLLNDTPLATKGGLRTEEQAQVRGIPVTWNDLSELGFNCTVQAYFMYP